MNVVIRCLSHDDVGGLGVSVCAVSSSVDTLRNVLPGRGDAG